MLPNLGPKPQYDFIFVKEATRSHYQDDACVVYSHYYDTEAGKLVKKPYTITVFDDKKIAEPCYGSSRVIEEEIPELFVYRTSHEMTYPISFEQASQFETKGEIVSPDGFTVSKRFVNRGIMELFGGNNDGIFISKKNQHIKIDLGDELSSSYYYENNFNFVSWINPLLSPPGQR